jgi:hypothetical protein
VCAGSREIKLHEVEPLLPLAKQLQDIGIGFETALPWIETIHECAEAEKLDLRTASYRVAQDLRFYRSIVGIEQEQAKAQQQLGMLNFAILQKQQAISTLMELQSREYLGRYSFRKRDWSGLEMRLTSFAVANTLAPFSSKSICRFF